MSSAPGGTILPQLATCRHSPHSPEENGDRLSATLRETSLNSTDTRHPGIHLGTRLSARKSAEICGRRSWMSAKRTPLRPRNRRSAPSPVPPLNLFPRTGDAILEDSRACAISHCMMIFVHLYAHGFLCHVSITNLPTNRHREEHHSPRPAPTEQACQRLPPRADNIDAATSAPVLRSEALAAKYSCRNLINSSDLQVFLTSQPSGSAG